MIYSVSMHAVIIIPTYNEAENIKSLLLQIEIVKRKVKDCSIQVLVVDDNSPDGTGKIVEKISKNKKWVYLLSRKKKVGLGAAYLAGMDYAFSKLKADLAITMDADLSHNPSYIPQFLNKIKNGADFVIGSRYIKGGQIPKEWALHRKIYSVFGNKIATLFLGFKDLSDWTSGYRAIKAQVFKKVFPYVSGETAFKGYTFNMSFAYHVLLLGFKAAEVPIKFPDRKAGKSKLGLEYLIHTPIFLVRARLKENSKVS